MPKFTIEIKGDAHLYGGDFSDIHEMIGALKSTLKGVRYRVDNMRDSSAAFDLSMETDDDAGAARQAIERGGSPLRQYLAQRRYPCEIWTDSDVVGSFSLVGETVANLETRDGFGTLYGSVYEANTERASAKIRLHDRHRVLLNDIPREHFSTVARVLESRAECRFDGIIRWVIVDGQYSPRAMKPNAIVEVPKDSNDLIFGAIGVVAASRSTPSLAQFVRENR